MISGGNDCVGDATCAFEERRTLLVEEKKERSVSLTGS